MKIIPLLIAISLSWALSGCQTTNTGAGGASHHRHPALDDELNKFRQLLLAADGNATFAEAQISGAQSTLRSFKVKHELSYEDVTLTSNQELQYTFNTHSHFLSGANAGKQVSSRTTVSFPLAFAGKVTVSDYNITYKKEAFLKDVGEFGASVEALTPCKAVRFPANSARLTTDGKIRPTVSTELVIQIRDSKQAVAISESLNRMIALAKQSAVPQASSVGRQSSWDGRWGGTGKQSGGLEDLTAPVVSATMIIDTKARRITWKSGVVVFLTIDKISDTTITASTESPGAANTTILYKLKAKRTPGSELIQVDYQWNVRSMIFTPLDPTKTSMEMGRLE